MLHTEVFSKYYRVKPLASVDAEIVLEVEKGNPQYYSYCPPAPTVQGFIDDLTALPPKKTAFIGFFMMNEKYQGRGEGSRIIQELLEKLLEAGFEYVRLGYMKGNEQSRAFWEKNGFIPTGVETDNGQGIVVVMQKELMKKKS